MNSEIAEYRVPFADTDAMGIVYHAHYVRYLEIGRVRWMDRYDRPYREYMNEGMHFATTRVEVDYLRPAEFDDVIAVETWLDWIRGASLGMAYELRRGDVVLVRAATVHALVDSDGRPRPIPRDRRDALKTLAARSASDARRASGTGSRSR